MKENISDQTHRIYTLRKALGVMALALLVLVDIAGAAPFAYITNSDSNSVSVIDGATNTVISTVFVGNMPHGVAVTPDGSKVYVTNQVSNNVSVINTTTNTVTATVNVGLYPKGVTVSPDGTKVYVTSNGKHDGPYYNMPDTVSVIDTISNKVATNIYIGQYQNPVGIAVSQDGKKVYVTNSGSHTVSVIDTATNKVTATINVEYTDLFGVAVTQDGNKVYVTNERSNNVYVIDTATNKVTATIDVGSKPMGVSVSPDGTKVYVTNHYSQTVSVIDTSTNTVTATVTVGFMPQGVSVSQDGKKVYVANWGSDSVSVIDTATNTVTSTVPVGRHPIALGQFIVGSIPEGTNLYLSIQAPYSKDHGSSMTYTLHYSNLGNASPNNVVLEDKLPNYVVFESASDGGVYDSSTRTVRWSIGSINSTEHGYRTLNVSIPQDVPGGTVIVNNANISMLDYNYEAQAKTSVTGLTLPPNVGVEPNNGGIGTPSVNWKNSITFSYHSDQPVTSVGIRIHVDDGGPDIIANMTTTTSTDCCNG